LRNTGRIKRTDRLLDFVFPPHCPVCGKPVLQKKRGTSVRLICPACVQKITVIRAPYCMKCGKPLTDSRREYCTDCLRHAHAFEQGRAVFSYQGALKHSLYRFKYDNKREYSRFYASAMNAFLGRWIMEQQIDCIVPVPLHASRQKQRGYNQAELLAYRLGEYTGIPVVPELLARTKKTEALKNLSGSERRENLKHAFTARKFSGKDVRILLVDDIYTTGSTLDAAAEALQRAGSCRIYAVCVAAGG